MGGGNSYEYMNVYRDKYIIHMYINLYDQSDKAKEKREIGDKFSKPFFTWIVTIK